MGSTLSDRFWPKVDASGDCWEWTAATTKNGYGWFNLGSTSTGAHRVSWMLLIGPIPDGLVLDHLCRNPPCVNPDHLEVVTQAENARRSFAPTVRLGRSGRCARGHPRSESYIRNGTDRVVFCRVCRRENNAQRKAEAIANDDRVCAICNRSLAGRRADTKTCGSICRGKLRRVQP